MFSGKKHETFVPFYLFISLQDENGRTVKMVDQETLVPAIIVTVVRLYTE